MPLVLLRGGSRDGESTTVDESIERLLAASHAPGLIDIYDRTDELSHIPGNDEDALVYLFTGQQPATEVPIANLHMPHTPGYA
jgi:hypothetical protein